MTTSDSTEKDKWAGLAEEPAPRCPECNAIFADWPVYVEPFDGDTDIVECECGAHFEYRICIVPTFKSRLLKRASGEDDGACLECGGSGGGPDPENRCPVCGGTGEKKPPVGGEGGGSGDAP